MKTRKAKDEKDPKTKLLMSFFESLGATFVDVSPKEKTKGKKLNVDELEDTVKRLLSRM